MTHTSPAADAPAGAAADAGTLRALEFAAIVEQLATHTAFAPSRELALASLPVADATHVGLLQDQTDEADRLLAEQAQASIGGARDIRACARAGRARRTADRRRPAGDGRDARRHRAVRGRLRTWRGAHLGGMRDELDAAPELAARITRSVDESGELLDTASAELAAIRKRLRTAQERVRERLNAMLRSSQLAGVIGEPIVTVRAGRYVIPIRAEAKGRVKGIVHDQSSSGATLFIEPLTVVELNNTWTEATLAEQREEERILDELSREVEARADALRVTLAGAGAGRPVDGACPARGWAGWRAADGQARMRRSCSPHAIRCSARRAVPIDLRSAIDSAIGRSS